MKWITLIILVISQQISGQHSSENCPQKKINWSVEISGNKSLKYARKLSGYQATIGATAGHFTLTAGIGTINQTADVLCTYAQFVTSYQVVDQIIWDSTYQLGTTTYVIRQVTNVWDSTTAIERTTLHATYHYVKIPLRLYYVLYRHRYFDISVFFSSAILLETKRLVDPFTETDYMRMTWYGARSKSIYINYGAGFDLAVNLYQFKKDPVHRPNPFTSRVTAFANINVSINDRFTGNDGYYIAYVFGGLRFYLF